MVLDPRSETGQEPAWELHVASSHAALHAGIGCESLGLHAVQISAVLHRHAEAAVWSATKLVHGLGLSRLTTPLPLLRAPAPVATFISSSPSSCQRTSIQH